MVRVLYRWRVEPARRAAFRDWWHEGTIRIRTSYQGALGSTLLSPADDDAHLVAMARWRSRADLEHFWATAGGVAFDGAVMESAEIFEELDDLTITG
jgi:hypothetical protein